MRILRALLASMVTVALVIPTMAQAASAEQLAPQHMKHTALQPMDALSNAVAFADSQWNCATVACTSRVAAGQGQSSYQCAEFVARSLAAGGLIPGMTATSGGFGNYVYNGHAYNLLWVSSKEGGSAGLEDFLIASGQWTAGGAIGTASVVFTQGSHGAFSHVVIGVGGGLIDAHNSAWYHVSTNGFGVELVYNWNQPGPQPKGVSVGMARTPTGNGYWVVGDDGSIHAYGDAPYKGGMNGRTFKGVMVGMAGTADGRGYWEVANDGGVFSFGTAHFYGSMGSYHLNAPIVGMARTPDGAGYWEVASDGGIFSFGDAGFYGSMGGQHLNAPMVGMAITPSGHGYWLVASDGGIFCFGDAGYYGSMGGQHMNAPVVGMSATPSGNGYWLVGGDGGIFSFGGAGYFGSMGGQHLNQPMVGMTGTPSGNGYWCVAGDGGIFSFGDAQFYG